ncbi:biopolymer transporter ExbD [Aliivibrio salmonicida]|jgi:biopolymer transport protein ExbD|uniref:TonB system transport protein ExbD1 n=1 Tax=Aliivibrio salmonicida (strain LFI1238) TaxID=316275 RepID=B6EN27_ALISL|nr:biopolymer transporter ExbD [Aliivibrio salmonicida]AZL84969.1 biopolymer transporter ExbD [Aliivibrio salmonicida]CAQ79438.1 TonB system transport protein ExbD1 [Aliivibrio salmonicida LFI1238]
MIQSNRQEELDNLQPDLTPLLDIIFIVMVFLLLTATVKLQSLEVSLPSAESESISSVDSKSFTINILEKPPYWGLDGTPYPSWENFTQALLNKVTQKPDFQVVIASDKTAEIQHMIKLLAFLQDNKIKATQILMDEKTHAN